MKRSQKGFTLIELVTVIIIIGILATVAIPAYMDLRNQAAKANVSGLAAAISSASIVNFTSRKASPASGVAFTNCSGAGALLAGGVLPTAPQGGTYAMTAAALTDGTPANCTITLTGASPTAQSATATVIGSS